MNFKCKFYCEVDYITRNGILLTSQINFLNFASFLCYVVKIFLKICYEIRYIL